MQLRGEKLIEMGMAAQNASENRSTAATSRIISHTVRVCSERYGAALRAVVLTGSLARGEGTWVRCGNTWRLLGDADLFLVFHSGNRLPLKDVRTAAKVIECALAEEEVVARITLAPVDPEFLTRMPRHIATFELRACGGVVWGDADVLSLVPAFSAGEISREDAWRMLANRIIELLESASTDEGILSARSQYATVKLILDMATSYLVFAGLYQPDYERRALALQEAATEHTMDSPFSLPQFAEFVQAATAFKLRGVPMPYEPDRLWDDAARYAADLWAWQLVRLTGGSAGSSAQALMQEWIRQMPWKNRLRGWASAARRTPLSVALCRRWLGLLPEGSPRYLTYAAAAELFFQLRQGLVSDPEPRRWPGIGSILPLPGAATIQLNTWQALAKSIAFNYHQLLESTTV